MAVRGVLHKLRVADSASVLYRQLTYGELRPTCLLSDGAFLYLGLRTKGQDGRVLKLDPADLSDIQRLVVPLMPATHEARAQLKAGEKCVCGTIRE